MDDFGTIVAPWFRYRLTPDDVLWLARSAAFEGDPAAVVWTYAQRLTLPEFRGWSMARLVQGHSQPTNPRWGRDGDFCRRPDGICWQPAAPGKCFDQAGVSMCSEARLERRDQARTVSWNSLGSSVRDIVLRFATARLSNPVPRSVDFAASYASGGDGLEVVKRLRNTFWSNPRSREWTADHVRIELDGRVATGSDGMDLLGLLAAGAAAAAGVYAVKRYRKRGGLRGLGVTSRRGPRTGTIELDHSEVTRALDALIAKFRPEQRQTAESHAGEREWKTCLHASTRAKTSVRVRDVVSGEERSVSVEVDTSQKGGAAYDSRRDRILLYSDTKRCSSEAWWRAVLRPNLAHEMTHASDPQAQRNHDSYFAPESNRGSAWIVQRCKYYNQPIEQVAHLRSIYEQIASFTAIQDIAAARDSGEVKSPADILERFSITWGSVKSCWPEKIKRRAMLIAWDVWERTGADRRDHWKPRRPGAGAAWSRLGELDYPPQPCGLTYKDFRGGWDYAAAYENVAWGRGDGPRTITPGVVKREMGRLKRAEYDRYQADCEEGKAEGAAWDEDVDPTDFLNGLRGALSR